MTSLNKRSHLIYPVKWFEIPISARLLKSVIGVQILKFGRFFFDFSRKIMI